MQGNMVRCLSISGLILISSICCGQDLSKTRTAKQITIKNDTVKGKVVTQQVFKFVPDTAYFKKREKVLDSIANKKKVK